MNPVQLSPVLSNLLIHLVGLHVKAIKMLVLGLDFGPHSTAKGVKSPCSAVKSVEVGILHAKVSKLCRN